MTERPALFAHRDWLRTRLEEAMRFSGLTSPEALAERVGIPAPALFSLLATCPVPPPWKR
ncbi:hypothetical protein [Deinococcus sp. S9]|uniref:hypothetical protein n=1 Tax=Deinococcus sp. S9 TaxID=2545754 RepID=UPI0010541750|nr:hypothetical protein [Deinococcus sp. S9]TDE85057.1 hypothetical protein E0686_13930 [Deinococcus sp. S9]